MEVRTVPPLPGGRDLTTRYRDKYLFFRLHPTHTSFLYLLLLILFILSNLQAGDVFLSFLVVSPGSLVLISTVVLVSHLISVSEQGGDSQSLKGKQFLSFLLFLSDIPIRRASLLRIRIRSYTVIKTALLLLPF